MRFVEKEDSYLDTKTGLEWSKENLNPMTWYSAMLAPKGWKLPTIKELLTIVDYDLEDPVTELPNIQPLFYWSATTDAGYEPHAWLVQFWEGRVNLSNKSFEYNVRYVKEK